MNSLIEELNNLNINQRTKYEKYKKEINNYALKAVFYLKKLVEISPEDESNKKLLKEMMYKLEN